MAVMIASDLAKDMSGTPLLRGVSFKLERKDRLTIAGRNGAGKTTLLRMLAGDTSIDGGELVLEKNCKVVLHDQRPPRDQDVTLRDYVLSACTEPLELEAELAALEARMGEGDESVFSRYADAQARFEAAGGYGWRDATNGVIHGLGFVEDDLDRPLHTFSGGQITRASLARALAASPDLLLLDEPTNHLDIESLEWLEQKLVALDAAVIMVAHDRWFLEAVGTCVLEVEAGRTRFFKGTWHQWRKEQAARELALGRAIAKQQKEIARMEAFVERFRAKATKAKQAQSRVKALDKIEKIERDPRDTREMGFQFKKAERTGRVIFELDGAHLEVGEPPKVLLHDAELWLERGEHVSLVGSNGTGKSTLVSALTGQRVFDAGKLRTGHNVKVGYLSQHGDELEKDGARTVAEAAVKRTGLSPNEARSLLGKFLFSGEEQEKPLDGLSGGERQRLSLAILVASGANVLILDEPTNHLDIESREALEDALTAFDGALILVSHDRALLEAVGTRTIAVERYGLRSYVGGWQEYFTERQARLAAGIDDGDLPRPPAMGRASARFAADERRPDGMAARRSDDAPTSAAAPRGAGGAPAAARATAGAPTGSSNGSDGAAATKKAPSKNRLRMQQKLERAIEDAEAALVSTEEELAAPEAWATPYESAKSTAKHTAAKRAVEAAYAALEEFEAQATA
ncbi:ATP-binding cassette domain-containing protein [Conexibacter sp. W3-3-2]|uniref:ABC-F family ATP-binding cassette domain-containing protein n=1 Tax=Conexibacter sp. W3-3-2 TaxID=2675227 RepID=UPI0012B7699A|nr:ABC-F family ATP-binding cassette domain-containing protein [Conexibacter sp. W3-3-2]MTD44050.1 ATP-binding cassette domain-containing protein [Conexibacter sp. W3-3-2]